MQKGEYDQAIQDFNAALAIKPDHDLALYNLGRAYIHKEQ